MKKMLLLAAALLLGAAAVTSCKKGRGALTEEQLANAMRTDWVQDALYGRPQKVVKITYDDKRLKWDSVANKPASPTAVAATATREYSRAGYATQAHYTGNVVTGAKVLLNKKIAITQSKQLPTVEVRFTYDSRNRMLSTIEKTYSYTITYAGIKIPNYPYLYVGDTIADSFAVNSNPLVVKKDSSFYKYEATYDDAAKMVTTIASALRNGEWVEEDRIKQTLNQYGFADENSSSWWSTKAKTASRISNVNHKENNQSSNWLLEYSYGTTHKGAHEIDGYHTRSIQYY